MMSHINILSAVPLLLLAISLASAVVPRPPTLPPTPTTLQRANIEKRSIDPAEISATPLHQSRLQKRTVDNDNTSNTDELDNLEDSNNSDNSNSGVMYLLTATNNAPAPYNTELAPLKSAEAKIPGYMSTPGHGRSGSPCSAPDGCAPNFYCNITGRTDLTGKEGFCTLQGAVEDSVQDSVEDELLEKAEHILLQ